jgi:tRNA nucleotidyltransferase/poly(A) polymerase
MAIERPATGLVFPELVEKIRALLPPAPAIYLVGGAVRDALRGYATHDLDFVLSGDVMRISRQVADALGAAFFPLDEARLTARLVFIHPEGVRQIIDFAAMRGPDLESDLRLRDFTINAMAVSMQDLFKLLDPLGGAVDLRAGILRACSPNAFLDDPVRILRAVRLATIFDLRIQKETRQSMREAVAELPQVSPERLRDELFRMLAGPKPGAALRALDILDALAYVLPELPALKGVGQSPPHVYDVWDHTLGVIDHLSDLLAVFAVPPQSGMVENLTLGQVSLHLGRYRQQIHDHLTYMFTPDRSCRMLLFLAALYHDVGKPATGRLDESGRIRFFEHEATGEELAAKRARLLRLSSEETERLRKIVRHHMRPLFLSQSGQSPTRRAIYRFFRDMKGAGVDVCLISLADTLATYGTTLPQDLWARHLEVVRSLLSAWWETPEESVAPPRLVDGHELIRVFDLRPGPLIGELLEAIREAQATGVLLDRVSALEFARQYLDSKSQDV